MTPKKKSGYEPFIYVGIVIVALYISAQLAAAVEYAELSGTAQSNFYMTVLNYFSDTVTNNPFHFVICQYTGKYMLYGGIGTIVVLLAITNSKKNYIHGKEFGTAKWGTLSDIKDLFADTIMNEEIKLAKEVKHHYGRWKARQKIYDSITKEQKKRLQQRLEALKDAEEERRERGEDNKKLYQEEIKAMRKEAAEETARLKQEAWKPNQLLADYKSRIAEIDESDIYPTAQEKTEAKKKAKADYEAALKDFYNGTSRIKGIKKKYKNADMLFTKTERISMYNFKLNNNTLILGGSGSGKTRGFVMPNILQAHSSYVVTDPKGEILEKAGYFLSEIKGYKIRVLNLDNKAASDGYNPFVYLRPGDETYEERVLSLIEAIIVNTDGGEKKGGSDPFWDKAERLFLQAIFFFTSTAFKPQDQNMNTVLALIGMLDIAEEEDTMNSDLDIFARHFEEDFGKDHIGAQQYREFRGKASGKTAKSIVISAVARLAPFRTKAVRRIFSYDSMHLDRLGEEETAIFVVVPPTDTTFNFIAGMVFTQMFQELQYCATQVHKHDGQRLKVPVRFILDEFANTCTIPNFVKILAYARSFGIGIVPILQSLEQIKNMYKDEWGVIVDNCNTLLYLGSITHMDTLEYMSKLLGKGTFDKRTTGRTRGRQGSSSENFDVVGRELMDASEIRKIPKKDCILVVGGRNPFYSEKYDYPSHPDYQYTSDANHSLTFEYVPEQPPVVVKDADTAAKEKKPETAKPEVKPDSGAVVESDTITYNTDVGEGLKALTEGKAQPLTDDMILEDGEEVTLEIVAAAGREEAAAGQKTLEEALGTVAQSRSGADEKLIEEITLETDFKTVIQYIGRNIHRIKPLTDEMTVADEGDGEETQEALTESILEEVAEEEKAAEAEKTEAPRTHGEDEKIQEAAGTEEVITYDSDIEPEARAFLDEAVNNGFIDNEILSALTDENGEYGAVATPPPGAEKQK